MELYLVRHGETESNRQKRYQGWMESPLSEKGLKQAEKAGLFLGNNNIDGLFCSDLERAFHTARVIGSFCGLKPEISPLLREIHFGRWEGMTYNEIEARWGEDIRRWFDDPFTRSAPEGETIEQVCERMLAFLNELPLKRPDCNRVIVVSHGGSIRALLQHFLNLNRDSFWNLKVENASISLVHWEKVHYRVIYYNRVDHLDDDLDTKTKEVRPDGL